MGIVYPNVGYKYLWTIFFSTLKDFERVLLHPMSMRLVIDDKSTLVVFTIFSSWNLDVQQGFFKLIMKLNLVQVMVDVGVLTIDKAHPLIINPFTHLWCIINACQLLFYIIPKYLKLVESTLIHIFEFIEDEKYFNLR
jgi:Na+-transporting methylmalonyl-CoA/oxaloacetate decarboxylase beta subunit